MSDVEWDAEDFEADEVSVPAKPVTDDKWAGEDEDEDTKLNWDDEEEENTDPDANVQVKKKKKNLKDIIAEKEEKKRKELEERRKQEEEARRKLTPEEILEEKLLQRQMQEDGDLELAKEAFGVQAEGLIDSFEPIAKEDFDKFSGLLCDKITKFQRSTFYVGFLEELYRDLAIDLEAEEVKKLSSSVTALYNEKTKAQKNAKGKKKGKGKISLNPGKDDNYDDYTAGAYDDMDDFM